MNSYTEKMIEEIYNKLASENFIFGTNEDRKTREIVQKEMANDIEKYLVYENDISIAEMDLFFLGMKCRRFLSEV